MNMLSIGRCTTDPNLDDWYVDDTPLARWMSWLECDGEAPSPRSDGVLLARHPDNLRALLGQATTAHNRRKAGACALPSGRAPLYSCSQCGDLSCGTFAVRVTYDRGPDRDAPTVIWTDFAWDSAGAPNHEPSPDFAALPPVEFDLVQYENVIRGLLA